MQTFNGSFGQPIRKQLLGTTVEEKGTLMFAQLLRAFYGLDVCTCLSPTKVNSDFRLEL